MNNIIINKNNFGQILDKFYLMINSDKSIVVNYTLVDENKQTKINSFLEKIQKNPIKSDINPLNFQQNVRNEWK